MDETHQPGVVAIPVSEAARVTSLDVLRGFALLGILTMNITAFAMPGAAYFDPTVFGDMSGANGWVWRLTHVLGELKFMAIFSMLFGAGIVLMSDSAAPRRGKPAGLHYRRMAWLVLFGLLHGHLLWPGDILYWYGMCGLIVFLFRNIRPGWLIVLGAMSLTITSGLMFGVGLSVEHWPPEELEATVADLKPSAEAIAQEIAAYQGSWPEQMQQRVPEALSMQTETFLFWALWRVSGLMLLGMALFKLGVLSAQRSNRDYWVLLTVGFGIGIPLATYGIAQNFANGWVAPDAFFLGTQFNYWASLFTALGWIGLAMLICKAAILQFLTRRLAAIGRTAFSNYILQTVICTTLFYGHGFGLFGELDRLTQAGVVVMIWAVQLTIAPLWLGAFQFGPLEWLWRTLVYLKPQPFRRATPG